MHLWRWQILYVTSSTTSAFSPSAFFSSASVSAYPASYQRPSALNAISISSHFDSGNIEEVISANGNTNDEKDVVPLRIRPDVFTELEKKAHCQWFHFRAAGDVQDTTRFSIVNAGEASYALAWEGYTVCASLDKSDWFRCLDTTYDAANGVLSWSLVGSALAASADGGDVVGTRAVHFAYFAPYSWDRHLSFVGKMAMSPLCDHTVIGRTLDGRDLDLVKVGTGPLKVWVIARQHPGESQAEFYTEGLLERLTDRTDALAIQVREACTWHVVPNMNPDGSVRGHLRTNACGANLNREWAPTGEYDAPTPHRSPEVLATLRAMDASGVDLFVDVHGDELVPLNFLAGMEGLPNWGPRLQALQGAFAAAYARSAPGDMQTKYSYSPDQPGQSNLAICSNQIAHRFDCLGVTLEQPFKDCATNPDPERGWSPDRARNLGASLLEATSHVLPLLRRDDGASKKPFWENIPPEDAYKRPLEGKGSSSF